MQQANAFTFRLWHLFLLIAVAGIGLHFYLQLSLEVSEIEIVEIREDFPANIFQFEASEGVVKIEFEYMEPEERRGSRVSLFFAKPFAVENLEVGDRMRFRYRAKTSADFYEETQLREAAIRSLGIDPDEVQETIIATVVR